VARTGKSKVFYYYFDRPPRQGRFVKWLLELVELMGIEPMTS
jgi:hypothetical protein